MNDNKNDDKLRTFATLFAILLFCLTMAAMVFGVGLWVYLLTGNTVVSLVVGLILLIGLMSIFYLEFDEDLDDEY